MTPSKHLQDMHGMDIVAERAHDPFAFVNLSKRALNERHDMEHELGHWNEASERHSHRNGFVQKQMAESRTAINAMSDDAMDFAAEFAEAKIEVHKRSGGFCEMGFANVCRGFVQHTHHRKGRQVPDANTPINLLDVCEGCHRYGHHHPKESYRVGFMLHREGEVSSSVGRRPSASGATPPQPDAVAGIAPSPAPADEEEPDTCPATDDGEHLYRQEGDLLVSSCSECGRPAPVSSYGRSRATGGWG